MNNITIKNISECADLDRKINLKNGSIIIQKKNDEVIGVYMVISFRDHRNKYGDFNVGEYCSLFNLDSGQLDFEERCSRATTERRVLRHLTRAGYLYPYTQTPDEQDYKFQNMRIQVFPVGEYKIEIELGREQIIGGTR